MNRAFFDNNHYPVGKSPEKEKEKEKEALSTGRSSRWAFTRFKSESISHETAHGQTDSLFRLKRESISSIAAITPNLHSPPRSSYHFHIPTVPPSWLQKPSRENPANAEITSPDSKPLKTISRRWISEQNSFHPELKDYPTALAAIATAKTPAIVKKLIFVIVSIGTGYTCRQYV